MTMTETDGNVPALRQVHQGGGDKPVIEIKKLFVIKSVYMNHFWRKQVLIRLILIILILLTRIFVSLNNLFND